MLGHLLPRITHHLLVSKRRYIYHILSGTILEAVLRNGFALKPRGTGCTNNYANGNLISQRNSFVIKPERLLRNAVPFYLSPRQPMFCRLVRERQLTSSDIVALGFDINQVLCILSPKYAIFSTNPIYPGAVQLDSWDLKDQLHWHRLAMWRWNHDNESKDQKLMKSAHRQAEVDIFATIPLTLLNHVVTDVECPDSVSQLPCRRIAIKGLSKW